jgi:uncharacterized protein (TIRG00374 family)
MLVALVITFADLPTILSAVNRIGPAIMVSGLIISLISIMGNACKWHLLTPQIGVLVLFRVLMISQFYSFFLLGQASGEAAKVIMLARASGRSADAIVSVLADRVTSLLGLLIVAVLGFSLSSGDYPDELRWLSIVSLLALVAGLLALRHNAVFNFAECVIQRIEQSSTRLVLVARPLRRAIEQWHMSFRDLRLVAASTLIGSAVQITNVSLAMLLAHQVGIHVPFWDWCWIFGIVSIAGLIPITIGTVTAGSTLVGLLGLIGVPVNEALAMTILLLTVNFMLALTGAGFMWHRTGKTR